MTAKRWLVALGAALSVSAAGCVSCGHDVCKRVLTVGPTCDTPLFERQNVYVFLVNGLTPTGLDGLREPLAERGFAKVYSGQLCHLLWMRQEMGRIHAENPTARVVVVGYDFGCAPATAMARGALERGIPVDAVVLLDPAGTADEHGCPARTVLAHCGAAAATVPHTQAVAVAGANHFTLPTHPQTVETLAAVLKDAAARVEHPPVTVEAEEHVEGFPPRRSFSSPSPADGWNFLYDQPGPHAVPLSPVPPKPGTAVPYPAVPPADARPLPFPRPLGQTP